MDKTRKNTLKIVFEPAAKVPQHLDILRFVGGDLKISAASVHSIYKDENEQQFYIKFIDDAAFNEFADDIEEQYTFEYIDLSTTTVRLDVASSLFRYVRIFNLPPEIEDKEIASVLGKFGVIRQHVREKYPAVYGFSVYSGVRGVHMEITQEIPANLFIGHYKARLYYEGLKNKCFHCKCEGHLKVNCPKLAGIRGQQNGGQYSQVLTNAIIGSKSKQTVDTLNMTVLPVPLKRTNTVVAQPKVTTRTEQPCSETITSGAVVSSTPLPGGSGERVTIEDDLMGGGDKEVGEGDRQFPDISSDESNSDFKLVTRGRKGKSQSIPSTNPVSPIEAIGNRSRTLTRSRGNEKNSRSRSRTGPRSK